MNFDLFIENLRTLLRQPLPGSVAHGKMSPLKYISSYSFNSEKAVQSGVLILLYPYGNDILFPLIQRSTYKGVHSGQISLPGGRKEDFEEDIVETALREAEEEIGVPSTNINILGTLTQLYIPASNFNVHPVVGFTTKKPEFLPDPIEVSHILEVAISTLNEKNVKEKEMKLFNGSVLNTPYFEIEGQVVWGATAMILSELVYLLNANEDGA